jgi:hypothetical protein
MQAVQPTARRVGATQGRRRRWGRRRWRRRQRRRRRRRRRRATSCCSTVSAHKRAAPPPLDPLLFPQQRAQPWAALAAQVKYAATGLPARPKARTRRDWRRGRKRRGRCGMFRRLLLRTTLPTR